ncbi:type II secretion system minor pseudopilin GspJ [Hyphomonas sp.]|jgi:general secretion pathway protein J|uniref:type II secretion system minor pseudopilin GspJ n=1 Tax=Hyphomonas sp. TaxID=87 RepID=UPI0039E2465B
MKQTEAGFTLIETLVALGVTAMLATAGTLMMLQTLQASRAIDARMADVRTLEAANGLLRADFSEMTQRPSAAPDDFNPPLGFTGRTGVETGDLISFVRSGWRDPQVGGDRSDLQRVAFRLEDGQLIRKAWLRPDPVRDTPVVERVLLDGISDLEIRYRQKGVWFDEWPGDANGRHPDLVQLDLEFPDADQLTLQYMVGATP